MAEIIERAARGASGLFNRCSSVGTKLRSLLAVLLALQVVGCDVEKAQEQATAVVVPAVVAVREAVEEVAPKKEEEPKEEISTEAVKLLIEFEVGSRSYYESKLRSPVWPGASSGVTWGIGYDGGYHTKNEIRQHWKAHPKAERLAEVSGIVGQAARALIPGLIDVTTPYILAENVFIITSLPEYVALSKKTFANGWDKLSPNAQGALILTIYHRGASMKGDARKEMRTLRDVCVPRGDTACMAEQFRSMARIWKGTNLENGLTKRYNKTAQLALS